MTDKTKRSKVLLWVMGLTGEWSEWNLIDFPLFKAFRIYECQKIKIKSPFFLGEFAHNDLMAL